MAFNRNILYLVIQNAFYWPLESNILIIIIIGNSASMGAKQKNRGTTMRSRQDSRHIKRKFRGRGEARDLSKRKFRDLLNSFFRGQGIFQGLEIKISRSRRDRGEEFFLIPRSFRGRCEDLADLWISLILGNLSSYLPSRKNDLAPYSSLSIHIFR